MSATLTSYDLLFRQPHNVLPSISIVALIMHEEAEEMRDNSKSLEDHDTIEKVVFWRMVFYCSIIGSVVLLSAANSFSIGLKLKSILVLLIISGTLSAAMLYYYSFALADIFCRIKQFTSEKLKKEK